VEAVPPPLKALAAARSVVVSLVAAAVTALGACTPDGSPSAPPATSASPASAPATERVVGPLTAADAQALATMNERLKEYVALHMKLERSLPTEPKGATQEQIVKNQRAFETLLRQARRRPSRATSSRRRHAPSSNACSRPSSADLTASK